MGYLMFLVAIAYCGIQAKNAFIDFLNDRRELKAIKNYMALREFDEERF